MNVTRTLIVAAALLATTAAPCAAQPGGTQWSPDAARLYVNKDVGAERWAITLNLADRTVSGNVFFTDGRSPAFIWCERTGHNHEPSLARLQLNYRCLGSDAAEGVFAFADWSVIAENVTLNADFFIPEPETCNLSGATNGANASSATSFWQCGGTGASFQFRAFADGTGVSSAIGPFTYSVAEGGCGFGQRGDGAFFHALYSPSKDVLNLYETNPAVTQFIISECRRQNL